MELIHKSRQDNIVFDALSKEKFQMEKPLTNIQALKSIFQKENNFQWKITKPYVQDLLAQWYFKKLWEQRKVKDITLK